MTDDPIAYARSLLEVATPRPWLGLKNAIDGGKHGCDAVVSATCEPCGWAGCSGARVVLSEEDARLITLAVNCLPELLAVAEAARGARAVHSGCDIWAGDCPACRLRRELAVLDVKLRAEMGR